MKITTAVAGDVIYDSDGDPWERLERGAVVECKSGLGERIAWAERELAEADERFGPFTADPPVLPPQHP